MYHSAHHAVAAMIRYRERQGTSRPAPWPTRPPQGVSHADRWRYVYVHASRGGAAPDPEDAKDPLIVGVLFDRFDRRRYLTRYFIEFVPLSEMPGRERRRARCAIVRFKKELCRRGLLLGPPKECPENVRRKYPACRECCRGGR